MEPIPVAAAQQPSWLIFDVRHTGEFRTHRNVAEDGTCEKTMIPNSHQPDFPENPRRNSMALISLKTDTERRQKNSEPRQPVDHLRGTAEIHIQSHRPENIPSARKSKEICLRMNLPRNQRNSIEPNKAVEPTPVAVTNRAFPPFGRARFVPSAVMAHL